MPDNRRHFIRRGGLLLGAAAAGLPVSAAAAPAPTAFATGAHAGVFGFLRSVGAKEIHLAGGSVLGAKRAPFSTKLVAVVADAAAVFAALASGGGGFKDIYAEGSRLAFFDGSAHYTLEILLPAAFASLKSALGSGQGVSFAHEALLKRVETGAVFDPFGIFKPGGRTLRVGGNLPASAEEKIALYAKGRVEAALYGLPLSASFTAFGRSLLAGRPANVTEASGIANEAAACVTLFASHAGPDAVAAFLASSLVSSSLRNTFGVTGAQAVGYARRLATPLNGGAAWLAGILGSERLAIRQGRVWISETDRFSSLQSNAALARARAITASAS